MSEATTPDAQPPSAPYPWARDALLTLFFVSFFGCVLFVSFRSEAQLRGSGGLRGGVLAPQTFQLTVWHQNQGDLSNGRLSVWITGKGLNPRENHFEFSYEKWPPNQEHARTYTVQLLHYDPKDPIEVRYSVESIWTKSTTRSDTWVNGGWKQ